MRNTGTTTWSPATFKLGSQNPQNNTTWGVSRALLPKTVMPGGTGTFKFTITAPITDGTYNFQWQMLQDGVGSFGQMSTNVAIQVGSGGGGRRNQQCAVRLPERADFDDRGQIAPVTVTMQNTGTTTWAAGTYVLRSVNPQGNSTWGLSQVSLASSVAPGASVTLSFNATAPGTAGSYNFQWSMFQTGVGYFGASSTNVVVNVTSGGGGGTNGAQFVSQNVPSSLSVGQATSVTVTMRNNGTTTWAAGSYCLQSQNPVDNMTWGVNRVALSSPVAPGADATVTFNITAPSTSGAHNFQWRMSQDGVGAFGDSSLNAVINVTSGSAPPLVITTLSLPSGTRNVAYSVQLNATGGVPPYTWTVSAGTIAPGLTVDRNTGRISGVPTVFGTYNFSVTVRDPDGRSATRGYKLAIK